MPAKQVLIVEDERPIREMIAFGLKRAGFEVREAEDCRAARAAVADARPDLVLVDWMLPDMSGLELTRALKSGPGAGGLDAAGHERAGADTRAQARPRDARAAGHHTHRARRGGGQGRRPRGRGG